MTTSDWSLAQTKANSHAIAQRNLARQGFEVFLPMIETTRRQGPRFVTRRTPLFPGYMFVRATPTSADLSAIRSTVGVSRLLVVAGAPAQVPDALVATLRRRCDATETWQPGEAALAPGAEVRIDQGPFADFAAKIERALPDGRVALLLEIAGRHHKVTVGRDQIGPASS